MEELFGVSMDLIMVVLVAIFVPSVLVIAVLGWRNRIMVKLGLRNIPRRRAQTLLLIIGIMLSTVIISAAFGTGDTISYSIRSNATKTLGAIDEVIVSARATSEDNFGTGPYVPYERFEQLQVELAGVTEIDGMSPGIGEIVPAELPRTSLSEGQMRIAGVDPSSLSGFGSFHSTSGEKVRLEDLETDEAYINHNAAEEMDAVAGDEIRVFVGGAALSFRVRDVIGGGRPGRKHLDPRRPAGPRSGHFRKDRADQLHCHLKPRRRTLGRRSERRSHPQAEGPLRQCRSGRPAEGAAEP